MAKKRQLRYADPLPAWRYLSSSEKFRILLNHYENVNIFSEKSGIPKRSIWGYVNAMDKGKNINVEKYAENLKIARTKMNRRNNAAKKRNKVDAPFLNKTLFLKPYQPSITYDDGTEIQSHWIYYRVEHLTWDEIITILKEVYDNRLFTGFQLFRFEYMAVGAVYLEYYDDYSFKDDQLQKQYQTKGVIKLSTTSGAFISPWDRVYTQARDLKIKMDQKGLLRITALCFSTKGDHREKRDTKTSLKRK